MFDRGLWMCIWVTFLKQIVALLESNCREQITLRKVNCGLAPPRK